MFSIAFGSSRRSSGGKPAESKQIRSIASASGGQQRALSVRGEGVQDKKLCDQRVSNDAGGRGCANTDQPEDLATSRVAGAASRGWSGAGSGQLKCVPYRLASSAGGGWGNANGECRSDALGGYAATTFSRYGDECFNSSSVRQGATDGPARTHGCDTRKRCSDGASAAR